MTTPSEEEARARIVEALDDMERIADTGWCLCMTDGAEAKVENALRVALAALASRVSTPPSDVVVHFINPPSSGDRIRTLCCGKEPADLPETDRLSWLDHLSTCPAVPVLPTEPQPLLDADGEPTGWAYGPAPVRPRPAPTEPEEKR